MRVRRWVKARVAETVLDAGASRKRRRVRVTGDADCRGRVGVLVDSAFLARSSAGLRLEGAGGARHARAAVRAGVAGVADTRADVGALRLRVRGVLRARHACAGVVHVGVRVRRTLLAVDRLRHRQAREAGHAHAVLVPARSRRDRLARGHAGLVDSIHVPRLRLEVAEVPLAQVARIADALGDAVRERHRRQRVRGTVKLLPAQAVVRRVAHVAPQVCLALHVVRVERAHGE